ncbi:CHAT domain-containing protein [Actinomadura sp. 6K520]|uniref:CHAT domain-containing protein n=1 Tax=Actinomadura sp. 6K520 TaxID=2530364 RepID=UPI0014047213|nr:CHAT domain-containing protein [Actinomadura sp. 6K520]
MNEVLTLREMHRAVERLHEDVRAGRDRKAALREVDPLLRRLGRAMAGILGPDVGRRLVSAAADARRSGRRLRLGLDIGPGLLGTLPWEATLLPGEDIPLGIHDVLLPFRVSGATEAAFEVTGGEGSPLRVVALLASPQSVVAGSVREPLLDLETEELRLVRAASTAAGSLDLRVLSSGTPEALSEALAAAPADVVHLACHAEPGLLVLEDPSGARLPVGAGELAAAWAGRPPALVVLAGCSTGALVRSSRDDEGGSRYLSGLAQTLADQGVQTVVAMTAPVRDDYAGDLMAGVFSALTAHGDVLEALHEARSALDQTRRHSADGLPEWHVPVLFAGSPVVRAADAAGASVAAIPRPKVPLALPSGRFVGRRALLRAALRSLDTHAGLVVHGTGGGGKSAFLGEVLRLRKDTGAIVAFSGPVDPDRIMDEVADALPGTAGEALTGTDRDWRDRLDALVRAASGHGDSAQTAVTLVLDDFEANLRYDAQGTTAFTNQELGDFLTRWVQGVERATLLATSRHPLPSGHPGGDRLAHLPLPPLTASEAGLLRLRLPAVRRLPHPHWLRLHELIGGHPRTYGYLDALLGTARGPAEDVARRFERLVDGGLPAARARAGGILRTAASDAVRLTVRDTLLTELLALLDEPVRGLLGTAAVFRLPVPVGALVSDDADTAGVQEPLSRLERLGLISPVQGDAGDLYWVVHRWTAAELARLQPLEAEKGHVRAARHWSARFARTDLPRNQRIIAAQEAIHHFVEAGLPGDASAEANRLCGILHSAGHWSAEWTLCERMLAWVPQDGEQAAQIHRQIGLIARDRGDAAEAVAHMERALEVSTAAGDRLGVAFAAHQLGSVHHNLGRFGDAEAGYRQAGEIFAELGRERDSAASAFQISLLEEDRGRLVAAQEGLRAAMETFERVDDLEALTSCHRRMAGLAERAGDLEAAMGHCREALALCDDTGDRLAATSVRNQLGTLWILAGDYEAAHGEFDAALREAVDRGMTEEIARSRQHLGVCARHTGALDIAEEHVQAALEINTELGRITAQAACRGLLAKIAKERGDPLLGLRHARCALMLFSRTDETRDRAQTYLAIGDCLRTLGRYAAARSFYRKGIVEAENAHDVPVVSQIRDALDTLPPG